MTLQEEQVYIATILEMYKPKSYTGAQKAMVEAIEVINRRILSTKGNWTKSNLRATQKAILEELRIPYDRFEKDLLKDLEFVSRKAIGNFKVPTDVIEKLISNTLTTQGQSIKKIMNTSLNSQAVKLQRALAVSVAAGDSLEQITRSLKGVSKGLSRSQLKTIANTTISETRSRVQYSAYEQFEAKGLVKAYIYAAILDGRTSEGCRTRDGRVYRKEINDIGEGDKPPRHWNCRSMLIPTNDIGLDGSQKRASVLGPVDASLTYGSWLGSLSPTLQRSVLGDKYYDKYTAGTFNVTKLSDIISIRNLSAAGVTAALNSLASYTSMDPFNPSSNKYVEPLGVWVRSSDVIRDAYTSGKLVHSSKELQDLFDNYSGNHTGAMVYRGIRTNKTYKIGQQFFDIAPSSWSHSYSAAKRFADKPGNGRKVVLKVNGVARDLYDISTMKIEGLLEEELIMRPGYTMTIVDIRKTGEVTIVTLKPTKL